MFSRNAKHVGFQIFRGEREKGDFFERSKIKTEKGKLKLLWNQIDPPLRSEFKFSLRPLRT